MSARGTRTGTTIALAVAFALALAACALSACTSSSNSKASANSPQTTAVAQLDALKVLDGDFAERVAADIATALPEGSSIDAAKYVEKYFEGFDYEIVDTKVDGQTAIVSVTITCKSTASFRQAFENSLAQVAAERAGEEIAEQEAGEIAGAAALEAIDAAELVQVGPIDLPYVQTNGAWTPAEEAAGILSSALLDS